MTYRSDDRAALALESNIISLLSSVPSLEPDLRREGDSSILSIRTLAYAAMIQLQQDSHQQQSFTGQKAFMAAMDAAALLPMDDRLLQEALFFDPILSVCAKLPRCPPLSYHEFRFSGAMLSRS